MTGCDKHTKYKTLTFFFTGVPPLVNEDPLTVKRQIISTDERGGIGAMLSFFAHGPYAAKQCGECHETIASQNLLDPGKKPKKVEFQQIFQGATISGPTLVLPLTELCLECHARKSIESGYGEGLWVHGPVSAGLCTACHHPHSSPNRYMLLKENSIDLCGQCHAEGYITKIEDHLKGEECVECHNSHLGKNRFLLKKDYTEIY
jgi:predicted CXXCH cytochrome family protein